MSDRRRLERAYRQAVYRLQLPEGTFDLTIGTASGPLRRLLDARDMPSGALLTACNPGSRRLEAAANQPAQGSLLDLVRRLGHEYLPAVALDPEGVWPDEDSVLVLGVSRDAAIGLARRYGQNALVWIDAAGRPELVWAAPEPAP